MLEIDPKKRITIYELVLDLNISQLTYLIKP